MGHFRFKLLIIASTICLGAATTAQAQLALSTKFEQQKTQVNLKGWDHLHSLLVNNGVESDLASKIIADRRMPKNEIVYFKLNPKEHKSMYRKHDNATNRANALKFYKLHKKTFQSAAKQFGVNPEVILSILQVETNCGKVTGRENVFYRLARLSAIASPQSVIANLKKIKKEQKADAHYRDVLARAKWLEGEFLPHLISTIELARTLNKSPHDIKGSGAGAIGYFQFLPGNVQKYGVDGNNDGKIDPFNPDDVIPSIANYLAQNGWDNKKSLQHASSRKVIWHYNRSDSYITTVLNMAGKLKHGLS